MKKVQPKLLLFYGGTLAFVIVLFQGVTHYGNTRLVAAPNINGRYLSTEEMPGCPTSTRVLLTILQSGVYLNGAVDLVENAAVIEEVSGEARLPLSGRLAQQQITLAGRTPALNRCKPLAQRLQVAGTIASEADKKLAFAGTILLDSNAQPWQIKALRLVESKQEKGH
jgi:hypothetical protein